MSTNVIAIIKSAKDKAVRDRKTAIATAAQSFDKQIAAYDAILRQLSGASAKAAVKKSSFKKALPPKTSKNASAKPVSTTSGYPKTGTVADKLSYIIARSKRFLSIQQIGESVKKHEPTQSVNTIKRRFSKHLDKFKKQGKIVSYFADGRTYYGIPAYMEGRKVKKRFGHKHE